MRRTSSLLRQGPVDRGRIRRRRERRVGGLLIACWLAASASEAVTVRGRVVDADGDAVAGAEIGLHAFASTHTARLALWEDQTPPPEASARSRSDGTFEVATEPGLWRITVAKARFAEVAVDLTPLIHDTDVPTIVLPTARTMRVRVEHDGSPVEGALVMVDAKPEERRGRRFRSRSSQSARPIRATARTGEDGAAVVAVPSTGSLEIHAGAPGTRVTQTTTAPVGTVRVVLEGGPPQRVRVADAKGVPRPGAVVAADRALFPLALTDEEGHATVVLPAGGELIAITEDDAWARIPVPGTPREEPLVGTVRTPSPVAGVAVAEPDRDPVGRAWVWETTDPANAVRADAKGRYRLFLHPRDGRRVSAAAPGYFPSTAVLSEGEITRGAGPPFGLEPASSLRGKVVDTAGEPVEDVALTVQPKMTGTMRALRLVETHGRSDADGDFTLEPVTPHASVVLEARREGYAPLEVEIDPLPDGGFEPVRIEMVRGLEAVGVVVDVDDVAVADAEIMFRRTPPTGSSPNAMARYWRHSEPLTTVSDGDGTFRFRDLSPGNYDLGIRRAGFAPTMVAALPVQTEAVREDGSFDLGVIVLLEGAEVRGRVEDPEGKPIAEAEVLVDSSGVLGGGMSRFDSPEPEPTRSGIDGRFTVADLRAGQRINLSVSRSGYGSRHLTAISVPPEAPVQVVLEPAATLVGEVVDERGEPIGNARVFLEALHEDTATIARSYRQNTTIHARSEEDGRFELADVIAGAWRLGADAPGFQFGGIERIEVDPREPPKALRVELKEAAVLTGVIRGHRGEPVADATVTPAGDQNTRRRGRIRGFGQASSDSDGRYRLDRLAPGPQSVRVDHAEHRREIRDVEIRPGENVLDFHLERGLEISGSVIGPDGEPVAEARVRAHSPTMRFRGMQGETTDAAGQFSIGGLEDGDYTIEAEKEGFATVSTDAVVSIRGASVSGIVLRLRGGATIVGQVLGLGFDDLPTVQIMVIAPGRSSMPQMAPVDFEGRFEIPNVPPGKWTLFATVGSASRMAQQPVEIAEADREVRQDIEFGGGLTMAGQVVRGGRPVASTSVFASGGQGNGMAAAQTDDKGRFRLEGLEPGRYDLVVQPMLGGTPHRESVELRSDQDLRIELPDGLLSGRVVDETDGSPIVGAEVSWVPIGGDSALSFGMTTTVQSDSGGRFRLRGLDAGRYRLVATKEGWSNNTLDAEIDPSAGPVEGVVIRLSPARGAVLRVLSNDGRPVSDFSVAAIDVQGIPVLTSRLAAGEDGRVVLDAVPAGTWTLLVAGNDSATVAVPFTVPGPETTAVLPIAGQLAVDIPSLQQSGRFGTVTVTGPDGSPYRAVSFGQVRSSWPVVGNLTQPIVLPVGTWNVTASDGDGNEWSGRATVVPGPPTRVTLQ